MVFKNTPKKMLGKGPTPKKFQNGADEDENVESGKKRKNLNTSTPNVNAKNMHVSFQLPQSNPKSSPKVKHPPTPMPKRKSLPITSGKRQNEFQGMTGSGPKKQQLGSGKNKAGNSPMQKLLDKLNDESEDDESDDDEDESSDEDESDLDSAEEEEIKNKLAAIKQKQMTTKLGQTNNEEDDDDEDDDMDEDESDDSSAEDIPSKQSSTKKTMANAAVAKPNQNKKTPNTAGAKSKLVTAKVGKQESDDEDSSEEEDESDDEESDDEEIATKLVAIKKKNAAGVTPLQTKQIKNTSSVVSDAKKSPSTPAVKTSPVKAPQDPVAVNTDIERKKQKDARHLFISGLPKDVTRDEVKTLSADIVDVSIPKRKKFRKSKDEVRSIFVFLEFASEKKAEMNFPILQKKKFRGQPFFVDFVGQKSLTAKEKQKNVENTQVSDMKRLFISGLPETATITHVAALFPKAISISINISAEYKSASILYKTEADAADELKKNDKPKIDGRLLTVLYSRLSGQRLAKARKRKHKGSTQKVSSPPAKKLKVEQKEESDDDDDDDDDDDSD